MNTRFVFLISILLYMPSKKMNAQREEQIRSFNEYMKTKDIEGAQNILEKIHDRVSFEKVKAELISLEEELKALPARVQSTQKKEFLAGMQQGCLEFMALVSKDSFQSEALDANAPVYKKYIELQEKAYSQKLDWWANQAEWKLYWDAIRMTNKKWLSSLQKWPYKITTEDYTSRRDISYNDLFPTTRQKRKEKFTYWEIAHKIEETLINCYFDKAEERATIYYRHPEGDGFIAVTKEMVIDPDTGRVISPNFVYNFLNEGRHKVRLIIAVSMSPSTFSTNNSQPLPHDFLYGNTLPVGDLGAQSDDYFFGFNAGCTIFVLTDFHPLGQENSVKKGLPAKFKDANEYLWYLRIMQGILEIPTK